MPKDTLSPTTYTDLRAVFINTTLKPSPKASHTEMLMSVSQSIMKAQGVAVTSVRAVDYLLAPGVQPDMTEHGFDRDDWPQIYDEVQQADILVLGTPIWLGERSSICSRVVERLYAHSADLNDKGQYVFYGKVGGCIVTGNEDGIKHVAMGVLYALQHLGYTIPPQADAGWIGEAGPGPSYGDEQADGSRVGFKNEFTQRNTTFMTWNLLHLARILKRAAYRHTAISDLSGRRVAALIIQTPSTARSYCAAVQHSHAAKRRSALLRTLKTSLDTLRLIQAKASMSSDLVDLVGITECLLGRHVKRFCPS